MCGRGGGGDILYQVAWEVYTMQVSGAKSILGRRNMVNGILENLIT